MNWLNHDCHLLLRTTSRPINPYKLSQSTSPRQVPWINYARTELPSLSLALNTSWALARASKASTWHVDMGAMTGILRFNMQTTWICPKTHSKLSHITISSKTTCQDQKAGIILNFPLPIILISRNDMSRSWIMDPKHILNHPTLPFLLPHFSPSNTSSASMSRWQGPIV